MLHFSLAQKGLGIQGEAVGRRLAHVWLLRPSRRGPLPTSYAANDPRSLLAERISQTKASPFGVENKGRSLQLIIVIRKFF